MSKLEQLIQELCPDGVEYKKTKELKKDSFWLMPATPNYILSGIPYITSKNIKNGKIDFENVNYISEEDYIKISNNRQIKKDDLLITMIGTIGETAFVEEETKFYGQNMYLLRLDETKINKKFFNYYLTSEKVKNSLVSRKNTSSQGYIKAGSIEELLLPVPPLEVQCEIVRILEHFTLLTAELTAELTARKVQYEYYTNYLLENNPNTKMTNLGELCEIITKGTTPRNFTKEGIRFIKTEAFVGNRIDFNKISYIDENTHNVSLKRSILQEDDILIAIAGTIGKCVMVPKEILPANTNQALAIIRLKKNINKKYVFFVLQSVYMKRYIQNKVKGSAQPNLNLQQLNEFEFPYPDEIEQNRIIGILETMNKLNNDISEGLPAEIEARQKQYEYYRDKLLTFKELKKEN